MAGELKQEQTAIFFNPSSDCAHGATQFFTTPHLSVNDHKRCKDYLGVTHKF